MTLIYSSCKQLVQTLVQTGAGPNRGFPHLLPSDLQTPPQRAKMEVASRDAAAEKNGCFVSGNRAGCRLGFRLNYLATSSLLSESMAMPKNSSLTGGQLFLLFCIVAVYTPFSAEAGATWAPFSPVEHFYACFFLTLLVHCLRRFFISPPRRQAITWFDFVVFLLYLPQFYDLYVDYSVITYGELLWRATTLLTLLGAHCWINKIPFFPSRHRVPPKPSSSSRLPTALICVLGFVFRTAKCSSTDPAQTAHPEPKDNNAVGQSSWRFWVLLSILLCLIFYRFVVLTMELDPVAALERKGVSIGITGAFGSVESIGPGVSSLTDADLIQLRRLTALKELELSGRKITDAALVYLEGLSGLKVLRLRQTQITDDGAAKLKKALPDCKIIVERAYAKLKTF
jgi:hypothetical protein